VTDAFADKVAIVTGGASGIGRALCDALAARGARVVVADINEDGAREVAARIDGRAHRVDVSDAQGVERLVESVERLDLMFNNAGIAVIGDAADMSLEHWNRMMDVNIRGVVHGTLAAYSRMRGQGNGHIVNTASMAGLVPSPSFCAYSMTKHAVVGLSTSLRIEAARYGVRISVVCPGIIDTAMARNAELVGGLDRERLMQEIPMSFYKAEDCARDILKGVAKNDAIITVTGFAKAMHTLYRLAPWFTSEVIGKQLAKRLDKFRT
jgi:NAD(P)-dependent dehydrogenase (short-subunit alcohol dehydrogenase family)